MKKKNSILSDERGQFSYVLIAVVLLFSLLLLFVFVAPVMTNFTISMYSGIEPLVQQNERIAASIQDQNVREAFSGALQNQKDNTEMQIETLTSLVAYSGIIIAIIMLLVLFLIARRQVQYGQLI